MEQNLSLYKIFYTTAEVGNISRAAKELYISQPAISKAIRRLEENLSVTLFKRSSRGVSLTEEGEILYSHVKSAFQSLSVGEEQLKQIADLGIGHLRIGVSTTLCKYVLLSYLQPFIKEHPHIRISIYCQSTNTTLKLLEEDAIDIGLIGKPFQTKDIQFFSLGEIQDTFVAADTYLENLRIRESSEADIFGAATILLLDKENLTRQYIDDYFSENNIIPNNMLEITTMDLLIEFARIGLGIACVIKEFVTEELASGKLKELQLNIPIPKREIGFAHKQIPSQVPSHHYAHKKATARTAAAEFIDFYSKNSSKSSGTYRFPW